MYRHAAEGGSLVEPFPLVVHRRAASVIRPRIVSGALSVVKLLDEPGFAVREAPSAWGESVWINLNRPQDMHSFRTGT
jgi:molybdopterin-guanine dinucleotide biosynthesis protein A